MDVSTDELTPAERERLLKLCQECGEVIQAATKAMMYGWEPLHNGIQYDNRMDIVAELADVSNVIELMMDSKDFHPLSLINQAKAMRPRMLAHMRHQNPPQQDDEEPDLVTYFH